MRLMHHNGLKALQFPALSALPGFFHGIFLRDTTGGQGGGMPFDLGLGGITPQTLVRSNRRRMAAFFGDGLRSVYGRQVHGREVGVIGKDGNRPKQNGDGRWQLNGDALMTDLHGTALVILVADCQAVLMVDPVKGVAANVHSGWRGSIQNIIGETVRRMAADFHSRAQDLVCGIGPSLGPCCAEFIHYKDELPEPFWKYRHSACHFDFWQASRDQLTDAGVRNDNIHLSGLCTRCNPHLFFSYRGERPTGRFAAVVGLDPGKGSGR